MSAAEQAGASAEELEPAEPEPVEAAAAEQAKVSEPHPVSATTGAAKRKRSPRRAGKQPGAPGFGRTVELPVTAERSHRAERCGRCGAALDETAPFSATTGLYVLDLEASSPERPGLILSHTKHLYGETRCGCGHTTVTQPGRSAAEAEWSVPLSEWHLVGPLLASLIVCLSQRMRLSRPRIREFLADWLGLALSVGTINRSIHEAGRAVAPLEDQLVEELLESKVLYADETTWKEAGRLLWLWVICSAEVSLYLIGHRTAEMLENVLGKDYLGWLMSDGYVIYRAWLHRLRCWAHLIRKARGLAESLDGAEARCFGAHALALLEELMQAVYQAREGPPQLDLPTHYAQRLTDFKALCEAYRDSEHKKTRALAREFLNDWEAIWVVLQYPNLPLTNNEAERALRHLVITRRISFGTRTRKARGPSRCSRA